MLAIIGPFSSGEAAVAFGIAEREKLVMMSNASSAPGLTDGKEWAWRITEDEGKQFARLLKTLVEMDVPRSLAEIVYVADERVANIVGTAIYPALLEKFGIPHGEPVAITYKSFDLAPQIAPIDVAQPGSGRGSSGASRECGQDHPRTAPARLHRHGDRQPDLRRSEHPGAVRPRG
ncbi:MAG: hypothetical protein KatS3mg118_3543 [Paracoccaceae bacterium]|nr:MAG: hypothetical protein KatS3mg118_3543 [Paracoccaceae bacterium]